MDGLQLIRKQAIQDTNIGLVTGEVTNARENADLINYSNLKERLDAMDGNLASAINGLEWKPSVPNFAAIATTYPNPQEGWTVSVDDTNKIYRYDSATQEWTPIMSSFENATDTNPGLMSPEDKKKLDTLNSDNYVHKTGDTMTGNLVMTNTGRFIGNLTGNADTTTRLITPRKINGVNFDGSMDITIVDNTKLPLTGGTLTGVLHANGGIVGDLTGNASTASGLETARRINGVAFDGSQDIVIEDNTKLPLTGGTLIGVLNANGGVVGNVTGNSSTSSRLQTPRNINGVAFDGSKDIDITIPSGTGVTLGGYTKPTIGGAINAGDTINSAIGKIEVNLDGKANANHNQASNTINAMSGYVISQTGGTITPTDTLNVAIGKLEYEVRNKTANSITLNGYTKPGTTSVITQGDTINSAIGKLETALDGKANTNHNQASNTINALTGYVKGTNNGALAVGDTLNIALAKLENGLGGKANANHNQASNTINAMSGYVKGTVGGAINQTDTLNQAIGKIEVNLDGKANTTHNHPTSNINSLNGYTKPASTSALTITDTLNVALGKLERGLDGKANNSHNQASNTINLLTGYVKGTNNGALATTDTLNIALAKLENGLAGKSNSNHTHNYAGSTTPGGVANSAIKLQTARTISLTGDVRGSVSFDGNGDVSMNTTVVNGIVSVRLNRLVNDVSVNTTTKTVNIGIAGFNTTSDILNVYLAGVRLRPNVDYSFNATSITGLTNVEFVNGDILSFEVIKVISQ